MADNFAPTFRDHIGIQLSDIILAGDIAFRHLPPIIIIIIIIVIIIVITIIIVVVVVASAHRRENNTFFHSSFQSFFRF